MKLIIYELNEIPRKLFDFYVNKFPNSSFAEISNKGIILNTFTKDIGELHPWSTWPTVHRGVYNDVHKIRSINQDLSISKNYKPIWEILKEENFNIGVFGSLQSYPPIYDERVKFHLPDTFAPKSDAIPKDLKEFQDFNLKMANNNKAISRNISFRDVLSFLNLTKKGIISKRSALRAAFHIAKEKINANNKKRRSIIQNVLTFDLYLKFLKKTKPDFSTYFTNHLAGMMHRYWRDLFPEDFNMTKEEVNKFNQKSLIYAMHLADNNLKNLLNFSKNNDYDLWLISSMGQCAIDRGHYFPELVLRDLDKLLIKLGLNPINHELLPAMQPDYCIKSSDLNSLKKLKISISKIKDCQQKSILNERYTTKSLNLHLILERSEAFKNNQFLTVNSKKFKFEELGFELITRDQGTGYHNPIGIFTLYGPSTGNFSKFQNDLIETTTISPTILKLFNINLKDYMNHSIF